MAFPTWLRSLKARVEINRSSSVRRAPTRRRARLRPALERLEDRTVPSPYVVTTTADSGPGSLRDAITQVNNDTTGQYANSQGTDEIDFNITQTSDTGNGYQSATGAWIISPQSALPPIMTAVVINGFTQPGDAIHPHSSPNTLPLKGATGAGDNAVRYVTLDGSLAGSSFDGLAIAGGNSRVEGLAIQGFGSFVHLMTKGGDVVQGNYFGTTGGTAIFIDNVDHNTIGGSGAGARNVIANGPTEGIVIAGPESGYAINPGPGANYNMVEGNYVGTDGYRVIGPSPFDPSTQSVNGINIEDGSFNTIGGAVATQGDPGNLVVGQNSYGVVVGGNPIAGYPAVGNVVQGNYVGLTAAGELPASFPYIDNILLSDFPGSYNDNNMVIGNVVGTIEVQSNGNTIADNFIGTNAAGTAAANPYGNGVDLEALTQ
jgi:hypothetical protein